MDRGAWQAAVHGVARVGHYLATKPPPPPNYGGCNEDMATSIKRAHAGTATLSAPKPTAGHLDPHLRPSEQDPTQEKTLHMDITRWSILKSDYLLCSQRWRCSIQSAKTRPGADCGSDCELLIAKFRLKLKKVGKTTRPFRYDLNQSLTMIQWK